MSVETWVVQVDYALGAGWEDKGTATTLETGLALLREYQAASKSVYRLIPRNG